MIFNEIYGVYYNAVAKILKEAVDHPLQKNELREIIRKIAFEESVFHIEPALYEGRWQLLKEDGTTPIRKKPTMPLTTIQKRWMKAISLDVRMKLFQDEILDFPDVSLCLQKRITMYLIDMRMEIPMKTVIIVCVLELFWMQSEIMIFLR